MKKLAVVIPAYNEEASIAGVVNDVLTSAANEFVSIVPVVVDDGSHDATSAKAAETSCVLLKLPCNLGIGGAVQTGFRYAFENNFDYAMQLDGDGQHPATEISKFFDYLQLHPHTDVVIGSRYIVKTGFQSSAMRRMGINMIKLIIRLLTRLSITDATSGFRLLNRKALAIVSNNYPDEYPEPESIIIYHKHNLHIAEIPVSMKSRQGGKSSIRDFASLYYMIKVSLAIFFTFLGNKKSI